MKRTLLAALLFCVSAPAWSQTPDNVRVPLNKIERDVLLEMCQAATWAARIRFEGACDQLRKKFTDAEAAPVKPELKK